MSPRTLFLSRLLGLLLLIFGLAMIVHKQVYTDALATLSGNPSAMLWSSMILVTAGLAMVLAHNVWTKCPVAVIVTVLGWLTLIKGVAYLLLPATWLGALFTGVLSCTPCLYAIAAFLFVLGAYLAYEGFKSRSA